MQITNCTYLAIFAFEDRFYSLVIVCFFRQFATHDIFLLVWTDFVVSEYELFIIFENLKNV